VTDAVEVNEPTVRERFVDGSGAVAEEVRPFGACEHEHGDGHVQSVGQFVAFDGAVHPDHFFEEIHARGPDRLVVEPGV
jgi:hypothetical protein